MGFTPYNVVKCTQTQHITYSNKIIELFEAQLITTRYTSTHSCHESSVLPLHYLVVSSLPSKIVSSSAVRGDDGTVVSWVYTGSDQELPIINFNILVRSADTKELFYYEKADAQDRRWVVPLSALPKTGRFVVSVIPVNAIGEGKKQDSTIGKIMNYGELV